MGAWGVVERQLRPQRVFSFRIARFSNVYHLSMHFPKNFGAETTKIFYIGLKGEWTEVSESREKPECEKGCKSLINSSSSSEKGVWVV